jgi:hypothetical protein
MVEGLPIPHMVDGKRDERNYAGSGKEERDIHSAQVVAVVDMFHLGSPACTHDSLHNDEITSTHVRDTKP